MLQLNSLLRHLAIVLISFFLATSNSNAESVTIPKDTRIHISMQTDVDSNNFESGDNFSAEVCEDVFVDNKMVLPIGTKIYGVVISYALPTHMDRSGALRLHFSSIKTLTGNTTRLPANLVAHGGVVTFKRGDQFVKVDAPVVFLCGAIGSKSEETDRIYAARKASLDMLLAKKGKHIEIKVGDVTKIQLQKDLFIN